MSLSSAIAGAWVISPFDGVKVDLQEMVFKCNIGEENCCELDGTVINIIYRYVYFLHVLIRLIYFSAVSQ